MRAIFLAIILALMATAGQAAPGWQRDTTAVWTYDAPTDMVLSGFKMYQDGNPVCEFSLPEARTASCKVTLTKRTTSFTLTAYFADGQESGHSDPYVLVDWGPKPKIITFTAK